MNGLGLSYVVADADDRRSHAPRLQDLQLPGRTPLLQVVQSLAGLNKFQGSSST